MGRFPRAATVAEEAGKEVSRLTTLHRSAQTARSEVELAAARIGKAVRDLYADPEAAHVVLAETSRSVQPAELAGLVRAEPALFGAVADPASTR